MVSVTVRDHRQVLEALRVLDELSYKADGVEYALEALTVMALHAGHPRTAALLRKHLRGLMDVFLWVSAARDEVTALEQLVVEDLEG